MTRRSKRDWHTPLLLTLSVHLMAFTLFLNHRLFVLTTEPQIGEYAAMRAELAGDDPESTEQEKDEGAAPGEQAEPEQPVKRSLDEIMRQAEQPQPAPPVRPGPSPQPVEPQPPQ